MKNAMMTLFCYYPFFGTSKVSKKHPIHSSIFQEVQKEREEKLVQFLLKRIEPYVRDDKLGFVAWARKERENLKDNGKYYDSFSLQAGTLGFTCGSACADLLN